MKNILLFTIVILFGMTVMAQHSPLSQIEKVAVRPADQGRNITNEAVPQPGPVKPIAIAGNRSLQKFTMSSSLNVNGIFVYDQRFVTTQKAANLFAYGNRAGGAYGNTGNDLKFKFTANQGTSWDSVVIAATGGKNFRYPSMIVYNPENSTNPDDCYGIFSGPITETTWTSQFCGSVKLDGQFKDVIITPNATGVYLNHMHVGLTCSPDGHATVASQLFMGTSTVYTSEGWEVLNGTFNAQNHTFDWQFPYVKVKPALLEAGRIDASTSVWSPDGSVGYLLGTAIDSNVVYNPYGVEWPVIYKSTNHGTSWEKIPAYDFSMIPLFETYLYPTRADESKIIPRWYNKWASTDNQGNNGATVDIHGNLHIFGLVRSTMSINIDSLNYFYSGEPMQMFDVFMKPGGGWDAIFVDSLRTVNPPDPGEYGISWDHQTQMSRTPDGSKVFCVWGDTDPSFGAENLNPDVKGFGYDAVTGKATAVRNFTPQTPYWSENWWIRVADQVFYDEATHTSMLPISTSIMGATNNDPLVHEYLTGVTFADTEFSILVGEKESAKKAGASVVSAN
ncbi:MAG: hypothetical protein NTW16_11380 [Bacteroidetes bacterium]|nr:hypothetical protein [Bacteroidota bacterium]